MVLDKLKQHVISRLKVFAIPIYLLIDIVAWNIILFFIYKEVPQIYGIKIIFAIVSFIFFFKYLKRWKSNIEVKLALRLILVFFVVSLAGSIIEIGIYSIINKLFLYTTVMAVFAATINASLLACVFMFVFKMFSRNFELEENVVTFYIPLIAKLGFIVYMFFSILIFTFLLNYITLEERSYLDKVSSNTLNEVLYLNGRINSFNNNIKNDMNAYKEFILNMYNGREVISKEIIQTDFLNRLTYFNNTLKNIYDNISLNIKAEYFNTDLPYSLTISKDAGTDKYTTRSFDALYMHNFLENEIENNDIVLNVNVYDRNNKSLGKKRFYILDENTKNIGKWIAEYRQKNTENSLGMLNSGRVDFQNQKLVYIKHYVSDTAHALTITIIIPCSVFFATRHCIKACMGARHIALSIP